MEKHEEVTKELIQHKDDIKLLIKDFITLLKHRGEVHDNSKFNEPEISALTKIKDMKFGSPEYLEVCKSEGITHHYKENSHHPEFYKNGMADMNILDLVEYFIDCSASASRRGGVVPDFSNNAERHKISPQLVNILNNSTKIIHDSLNLIISERNKNVNK